LNEKNNILHTLNDVYGSLWFRNPFWTTSPDDDSQIKDRKLWLGFRDDL